jgi:hypothetical protein
MLNSLRKRGKAMLLPTRIRRLALIAAGVPLAAAMTTMLASPAAAAPAAKAALVRPAITVHHYHTLVPHLRVRKAPHTGAPIVHVLGAAGTQVSVVCFAVGSSVNGDRIWYRIVAPHTGFVAGFFLKTGRDPAAGVPACRVLHLFRTLTAGLRVRQKPSTSAKVVHVLGPVGSPVIVNCFTTGTPVFKDNVWYHIVAPHTGFVAGVHLNTGQDPAKGVRHC